jgi:hypothetical protein
MEWKGMAGRFDTLVVETAESITLYMKIKSRSNHVIEEASV